MSTLFISIGSVVTSLFFFGAGTQTEDNDIDRFAISVRQHNPLFYDMWSGHFRSIPIYTRSEKCFIFGALFAMIAAFTFPFSFVI